VTPELWPRWIAVIVSGVAFGAVSTWLNVPCGDVVLDASARRVASLVVNAGAAWAGVAVLGGWLLGSVRQGLLAGPVALVPAVVVYYVLGAAVGSENPGGSADLIVFFSLYALVAGPPLAAVGALLRRRDLVGLVAALVVPVGVCVKLVWRSSVALPSDPARPAADLVLLALALAGAAAAVTRHLRAARGSQRTGGRRRGLGPG